jgi:hypothetical protein
MDAGEPRLNADRSFCSHSTLSPPPISCNLRALLERLGTRMDRTPIDVEEFRRRAADCVHQAESAETPQHRTLLLEMAQKWLQLADQATTIQELLDSDCAEEIRSKI